MHLTMIRHRGLYNDKRISKLLGDVRFVDDRDRRERNIRKRLVKIQQLYRILVESLRDDYIKYNINFANPESMFSLAKNKHYGYYQEGHQEGARGRQDNYLAFEERRDNRRLSPSKHGKVYVNEPTGDLICDLNRSEDSRTGENTGINYGIRR